MQEENQLVEQEQSSLRFTQKETEDLMYNGIRPEGMSQEEFKFKRAYVNKMMKNYLNGNLFHKSFKYVPVEGKKQYKKVTKTYVKMLVRCNTKGCANYGIPIENNLDENGDYDINHNKICPLCGNERMYDEKANKKEPSFNIDEIALGTKRLHSNNVKKYSY